MGRIAGVPKKHVPKTKCCVSKDRCERCPIRMLKDGCLPDGYGVHKRRLVRVDGDGRKVKGKVSRDEVALAVRRTRKAGKRKKLAA